MVILHIVECTEYIGCGNGLEKSPGGGPGGGGIAMYPGGAPNGGGRICDVTFSACAGGFPGGNGGGEGTGKRLCNDWEATGAVV